MSSQHRDNDQQNYLLDQARAINDEIEVSVHGPAGMDTPTCAEAWPTAKLIAGLIHRIEALEARDEDDKAAWAAQIKALMRRDNISAALQIKALTRRIDALEAAQVDLGLFDHKHKALGNQPSEGQQKMARKLAEAAGCAPRGSVDQAAFVIDQAALAISESFRVASAKVRPSEVATTEAQPNYSASPDSSLVDRVADAIVVKATSAGIVNDRPARAAIREVADWLRKESKLGETGLYWAQRLEQEASGGRQ